ncbi:MAG TPA: mannose-1-phosphate guanylyltransferase [Thermoanaerobaculia bacterium]|jgi:mannose-1-phosphate guanylyltransferase/mannose-6-phosphate isomerase
MRILLLAGGGGTRLWPLSTPARPKQFLPLVSAKSMLADTFERVEPLADEIFVATFEEYADLVRDELPAVPPERILAEPARRNSAPPILRAALDFERDGDPVTAALPSDHGVADPEAFRAALAAAALVCDSASVVVLGVPPDRPETDFGYLEVADSEAQNGYEVVQFIEKPDAVRVSSFLASGRHFWNAGIFVFRPSRFLAEARRVAGDLVSAVERYRDRLAADPGGARAAWEALPSTSIDYAVMERARGIRAVPLSAGWSDIGSWRAVRDMRGASDGAGNLILSEAPVLAPGVRDSAIVVGDEGILVLPFDSEKELRAAVERLRGKGGAGE